MKKLISLSMILMLVFVLAACGSNAESVPTAAENTAGSAPETVIIPALNAEKELINTEVPYDPQRIAVLDMAALDILDALDLGDRIVGSAAVSIDYLKQYDPDSSGGSIVNLGTVKTADLEKVAFSDPDVIFIGRRLSSIYSELQQIAPVVYLDIDYEKGVVESTMENSAIIASMFGKEANVDAMFADFQTRIDVLKGVMTGKNVLLGMYNGNALGLMDSQAQFNIITKELGALNLGETVGAEDKASHGEEASWETVIQLNPEYLFILDRNSAVGTAGEGIPGVREMIENDLIKELDVYKDGKIVYIIDNATVWYTAIGGIHALDIMLADLENSLLN